MTRDSCDVGLHAGHVNSPQQRPQQFASPIVQADRQAAHAGRPDVLLLKPDDIHLRTVQPVPQLYGSASPAGQDVRCLRRHHHGNMQTHRGDAHLQHHTRAAAHRSSLHQMPRLTAQLGCLDCICDQRHSSAVSCCLSALREILHSHAHRCEDAHDRWNLAANACAA